MPLYVLLPIVVLGILGIALLLHVLGKSKRLEMLDVAQVRHLWALQFPNTPVDNVSIADGGHQAMVTTADGAGLIWSMGADVVCRMLGDQSRTNETRRGLKIRLGDYTAPSVTVRLSDPATRQSWLKTLTGA